MGTNSSKIVFRRAPLGTGSTHPAKGEVGTGALGTSSTHPTGRTGKQKPQGKSQMSNNKDANYNTDNRRKAAAYAASQNMAAGKGINALAADHASGETCAQTIAKATRQMQKNIYVVTVTRGSKTRYSYGEKLKEALAVANPKKGESFRYAKFSRSKVQESRWLGNGIYDTVIA